MNTGLLEKSSPVLCEADDNSHWSSGLQVSDTLLTAKAGKSSRVEVENTTKHEILLDIGRLERIQPVTVSQWK